MPNLWGRRVERDSACLTCLWDPSLTGINTLKRDSPTPCAANWRNVPENLLWVSWFLSLTRNSKRLQRRQAGSWWKEVFGDSYCQLLSPSLPFQEEVVLPSNHKLSEEGFMGTLRGLHPGKSRAWRSLEGGSCRGYSVVSACSPLSMKASDVGCHPRQSGFCWRRSHVRMFCVRVCSVAQSCPVLCSPIGCSPPGSSAHGIFQTRINGVGYHFLF